MNNLKTELSKLTVEAVLKLFFMHSQQAHEYAKQLTALLSQRSCKEINRYLVTQVDCLRTASSKNRSINPTELYVVMRDCDDGISFECSYMLGETYFEPPLILPTDVQIKELWEYFLRISAKPGFCCFQEFLEKQITETVHALRIYEEMLGQEIVALEYALLSEQGVPIHNALYAKAQESHVELYEQGVLLKETQAPLFMQRDNKRKMKLSRRVMEMLDLAKPRTV